MARSIHRLVFRTAPKVIVLDCDNTLWGGAVAEVGAAAVVLSAPFIALQHFFVKQHSRGALLCLCSRNSCSDDVMNVWRERSNEMVLKLDHIVVGSLGCLIRFCSR